VVNAGPIDYPRGMRDAAADTRERRLGRYSVHDRIGSGGMATVHLGRLVGEVGFSRIVAIKCMASHLAEDPEFRAMFLDEARLAARIRHPNVVSTIDVGTSDEGMFLVMDYVPGESLAALVRTLASRGARIPIAIAVRILADTLSGLHAAHVATDEAGEPLAIVHRDVSPQNVLVATDGLARVLDFGIAKAAGRSHVTRDGAVRGKFRYMAPEQVKDRAVTPRTDVYAASVVLWEILTGERLFGGSNDAAVVARVLEGVVVRPSKLAPEVPGELDAIVLHGLSRDPAERFASAQEMAEALEAAGQPATARQVGRWVEETAGDAIERRREQIARMTGAVSTTGGIVLPAAGAQAGRETHTATRTSTEGANARDALGAPPHEEPLTVQLGTAGVRTGSPVLPRAVVAGVVAVGLATAAFAVTRARLRAADGAPAEPSTSALAADPTPGPVPAATIPALDPATPDVRPVAAAAEASAPRPAPSHPAVDASRPPGGHPRRCNPPYYQDPSGIRRVKPECL
jgi:hypothetical protein